MTAPHSDLSDLFVNKYLEIRNFWMAGGLGFEPRLAESESAVLPLDDPPSDQLLRMVAGHSRQPHTRAARRGCAARESTLRVLRAAAGLAATDLLALHFTGIAGDE